MIKKHDQKLYNLFQQCRFTLVLFVIVRIAGNQEAPYPLKPSVGSVCGYVPWSMAVIVFVMEFQTYRGMVGYLNTCIKR